VDLRSSLHVHDNPLAIAAAVSDFTIPPPSAIKFHTGAAFLPHLAKPKTSSAPAQIFFGLIVVTRARMLASSSQII
jgi:hypothetical protein